MYDKKHDKWSNPAISRAAQQTNFYGAEIEKQLNDTVERPANRVFDKLRLGKKISDEERWQAAVYLATMHARVPARRRKAQQMVPAAVEKILGEIAAQLDASAASESDPGLIARRREEFKRVSVAVRRDPMKGPIVDHIRKPWPTERVVKTINAMTWRIGITNTQNAFVTSDNPLHFFEALGLGQPKSELTFPFAKNAALYGSWRGEVASMLFFNATKPLVKECNRRIIHAADRFIFSREPASWIGSVSAGIPFFSEIRW